MKVYIEQLKKDKRKEPIKELKSWHFYLAHDVMNNPDNKFIIFVPYQGELLCYDDNQIITYYEKDDFFINCEILKDITDTIKIQITF